MNSLLDIFGSVVIAGMLFMMIIKLNLFSNQTGCASDNELKLIQNTKTLAEILDYDFRKIGYKYNGTAIAIADSNHIKFYADLDRNNTVDVLEYYTSDTTVATGTENPRDIILYRKFNGVAMGGPTLGLTKIKFTYLDQYNVVTNVLPNIKYVKVELWVESTIREMDNTFVNPNHPYLFTYWEMKINPRNI